MDIPRIYRLVCPRVDSENQVELIEISFNRGGHIRVLQFAGIAFAFGARRFMDLTQRRRMRGLPVKIREFAAPVLAEL